MIRFQRFLSVAAAALALSAPAVAQAAEPQRTVDQANVVIERFRRLRGNDVERSIPSNVMRDAQGLAIITVIKGGLIFSGRGGEGVVVARLPNGKWSGPSFVGFGGVGFGLQIGAQVTHFIIVLNTPDAVSAFAKGGNVALGTDLSAAAGPVGRNLSADVMPTAAIYSYSQSQGLFAGMSLEGTVIGTQDKKNFSYYHHRYSPSAILDGRAVPPPGAMRLIRTLETF
jgi:lipid-binding SYLF domain-containing protein